MFGRVLSAPVDLAQPRRDRIRERERGGDGWVVLQISNHSRMFQKACAIARGFTGPVVISHRTFDGTCRSSIGSFVTINSEGWCVTAWHIMDLFQRLDRAAHAFNQAEAQRAAIKGNKSLQPKERSRELRKLGKPAATDVTHCSAWWANDALRVRSFVANQAADIAAFQLENFSSIGITRYPEFKNPASGMTPGRSLCRIGFPFHGIEPGFDDATGRFKLPPGATPLPVFPNEGIMTRNVEIVPPPGTSFSYRMAFVETSSPGLRGQSGGPLFDARGAIWGIQSTTQHFPLGFSPPVPGGKAGQKEHQFLNVGWSTHSETVIGFLNSQGISFATSQH